MLYFHSAYGVFFSGTTVGNDNIESCKLAERGRSIPTCGRLHYSVTTKTLKILIEGFVIRSCEVTCGTHCIEMPAAASLDTYEVAECFIRKT